MSEQTASKVPRIRFKGFEWEWGEASVSDFVTALDAGVSVNSGDRTAASTEFGVLKTSAVTNGVFEADENKVVLTECEQSRLKESVSGGTIIISRMNTPALVGANAYVESSHENLFLPDRLWAAKPNDGTSMRFLACILGSEKGRDALSKLAKGTSGSMKNITKPDVLAFSVMAPSPAEQTQIGGYFRELDSLIGLHQRKHDKLVTLKKAMLQKMFPQAGATTPEIRFKGFEGEWVKKPIGDILSETKRPMVLEDNQRYELVTVKRRNGGVVSRGHLLGREILVKNYSQLHAGDFLISKRQVVHGATGIIPAELNKAIVSNEYLVAVGNNEITTEFLTILASLPDMNKKFFLSSYGVDIEKLFFDAEDWKKRFVTIPKVPEQGQISNYFRKFDALISKHATQLQKLQQLKSACLEKMFV
jgi:type I restriction enzyme S subunit